MGLVNFSNRFYSIKTSVKSLLLFFVSWRIKCMMRTLKYSSPSSVALLPLLVINSSPSAGKKRLYNGCRIDGKCMGTSKRSSPIHYIGQSRVSSPIHYIGQSRVCLIILVRVWLAHLSSKASIAHSQYSPC